MVDKNGKISLENMKISEPQIINLPKIMDPRGNLSIIEQFKQIPFEII